MHNNPLLSVCLASGSSPPQIIHDHLHLLKRLCDAQSEPVTKPLEQHVASCCQEQ